MNHSSSETSQPFSTPESVVREMYKAVSGPERGIDMKLQQLVFAPDARLIRMGLDEQGQPWRQIMNIEEYVENTREFLESTDFYEYETKAQTVLCPPFAHILSEYEAKHDPAAGELILSGVNSIQCLYDGQRWWVYQLTWNHQALD
ncbi:MAG TPA: hypothetical protein VJ984_11265 [Xanthomonadales bacterium]|nr:hypothetical protein [Xanthomonadales bacterium]